PIPVATQPEPVLGPTVPQIGEPIDHQPIPVATQPEPVLGPSESQISRQPPSIPSMELTGVFTDDGYEWLENPVSSGIWYMRNVETGGWERH
ncbi:MAG: hypothetical protein CL969_00710, partial [Euryarchaeota archaeon]|nr:hypothetical protein [Euryarchaeota archaeon]